MFRIIRTAAALCWRACTGVFLAVTGIAMTYFTGGDTDAFQTLRKHNERGGKPGDDRR